MWFFDDAFSAPSTATPPQWVGSVRGDSTVQSNEIATTPSALPVLDVPSDSADSTSVSAATDVVFEAPVFTSGSDLQVTSQDAAPVIVSQEVIMSSSTDASSNSAPISTESIAIFEPIMTTSVTEWEKNPSSVLDTTVSWAEIDTTSSTEIKIETPHDARNPEDILDDTERLLRQSEEALEEQAKILESEAALHQKKSDEEKAAADSALQAAQSAHSKAEKLEATIVSIQKEKEKLSVNV